TRALPGRSHRRHLASRALALQRRDCESRLMPKTKTATANIHAIVGSDEARIKRKAAELAQKLAPAEAGEFGLEIIDGAADNVDGAANAIRSAIAALQTLPFFGGGKLVWLKSANFLSDDMRGKSANVLEPLEALGDLLSSGLPN